ncbi:MAG TPA: heme ABC transporter ATP-binding protein [Sediminibacterium sp.]
MISVQQVSFLVKNRILVNNVSLAIAPGEFVVVMGANGAGKSTLLKMMSGAIQPVSGKICYHDKEISQYTSEILARKRAVLSQQYHISFPMTVREIVMMGRYPYFLSHPSVADEQIVNEVMEKMQVMALADRNYQTLSGGEAQKIQMCRVLAQIGNASVEDPKCLLLDEPVSHLDIKYQHQLLKEAGECCKQHVAVFAVLHDINLALKYADRILFMKEGTIVTTVSRNEILTKDLLQEVFDVDVNIFPIPEGQGVFVSF